MVFHIVANIFPETASGDSLHHNRETHPKNPMQCTSQRDSQDPTHMIN